MKYHKQLVLFVYIAVTISLHFYFIPNGGFFYSMGFSEEIPPIYLLSTKSDLTFGYDGSTMVLTHSMVPPICLILALRLIYEVKHKKINPVIGISLVIINLFSVMSVIFLLANW